MLLLLPRSSATEKRREPQALRLDRVSAGDLHAAFHERGAQGAVARQPVQSGRRRRTVIGRHQQAAIAGQRGDAPNISRHHREPGCERLEQHLWDALRVRDVDQHVALSVEIPEPAVDWHVAVESSTIQHPERAQARGQGVEQRTGATHGQTPTLIFGERSGEDVGEQQRVLLGIEPADAEHPQLWTVIRSREVPAAHDLIGCQQRDVGHVGGAGVPVAQREVRSHHHHRRRQRREAEPPLQDPRQQRQQPVARVAVVDQLR